MVGDRATVTGLMGAGVDPHLYKPTRSDMRRLMQADVIFYNGLLLEGKMTDTLIRAATSGKRVHAVTELLDASYLLSPEDFDGHDDPHVWMDPKAWSKAVDVVRDAMIAFDPDGAATYRANAAAYAKELAALDAYAERVLASVPPTQRVLVTAHDAFNYFGRRFGYEVVGIQGISTESEAGVQGHRTASSTCWLVERNDRCRLRRVDSLRAEHQGAHRRGQEARGAPSLRSGVSSSAMPWARRGRTKGTYIGMIDHNVTTIARALGRRRAREGTERSPRWGTRGPLDWKIVYDDAASFGAARGTRNRSSSAHPEHSSPRARSRSTR